MKYYSIKSKIFWLIFRTEEKKQYKTCTQCSEFFQCNIRQSYIQAVYESMNKGLGGGFEF